MEVIAQNEKIQQRELEECKPINILHEFLKRTLHLGPEIQTEIETVLMKIYIRISAEQNIRAHSRLTTFNCFFLKVS